MKFGVLFAGVFFLAAALRAEPAAVELSFEVPEGGYADVLIASDSKQEGLEKFEEIMKPFLAKEARKRLPEGTTLKLVFREIDLAGHRRSVTRSRATDARDYRAGSPPHFVFDWSLVDATGSVLLHDSVDAVDTGFREHLSIRDGNYLAFERSYFGEWMRGTARRLAKELKPKKRS